VQAAVASARFVRYGTTVAVRRYQDLIAWQRADEFKLEVYRIVLGADAVRGDARYRSQILGAASSVGKDICEGFLRKSPTALAWFLDCALGSLGEAENWLTDGIQRGYFGSAECEVAFRLARRCLTAMVRLKHAQREYARAQQARSAGRRKRTRRT
jgi:four helix bundle protein